MFKYNINLLLVHARGASKGMGEPNVNKNNHPFVSSDYSLGLVHNGTLDETEYKFLKTRYAVQSHCDSEMLLRIFESGELQNRKYLKDNFAEASNSKRLSGIKDIFSLITEGHMAVAAGERGSQDERMLWLFRNKHRPLWVIDMRAYLGQIFFVSEPSIWDSAIYECSGIKNIIKTQKLIELPVEEVWFFKTCEQDINVQKYEVVKESKNTLTHDGKFFNLIKKNHQFKVVTQLSESDQLLKTQRTFPEIISQPNSSLNDVYVRVYKKCDELVSLIEGIKSNSYNLKEEGSVSCQDMEELFQELDHQCQILNDLKSIMT